MVKSIFQESLLITGFILVMMLLIEYLNVLTHGTWQNRLKDSRWIQYIFAAVMGAIPGCLGAFTVVSLFSHGIVSLGAVVTTMIATSGDEAFVMLAMIPDKFLQITAILVVVGIAAGWLTDVIFRKKVTLGISDCNGFEFHEKAESIFFSPKAIIAQLKGCSPTRGIFCILLSLIILLFITGIVGPSQWNWIRVTLVVTSMCGLFIILTVSEHFLEEHIWKHVVKQHLLKLFLWVCGALLVLSYASQYLDLGSLVRANRLIVLIIAVLVGIIPESGPHVIFVTMYAQGILPLSVLMANSIVQDGHGMLPMLAYSRKGFVFIKAINLLIGSLAGMIGYCFGW